MIIKNFVTILNKAIEDKFKIVRIRIIQDNGREHKYIYKDILFVSKYCGDLHIFVTNMEETQKNCNDLIKNINNFSFFKDMQTYIHDIDLKGKIHKVEDILEYENQIEILVTENI